MKVAEILRELVGMGSPSAVSNVPLLEFVAGLLLPLGWRVEWMRWADEAGVAKANLLAWPGPEELPKLVDLAFVCHTDTVPYAAGWDRALRLEERDGSLHGCGACDVKGALACFLAAAFEVRASDGERLTSPKPTLIAKAAMKVAYPDWQSWPEPTSQNRDVGRPTPFASVVLILTADEEIGCRGVERLLAAERFVGVRIGSVLVSEPTSLRAGVAGKGYGLARVTVEGREAHSAFPAMGVSAISVAARLIAAIEDVFAGRGVEDDLFDPPRTTVNVGVLEGGTAKNILAGRCSFLVEWRPVPGELAGAVLARIRELAMGFERNGVRILVERLRDEPGFAPGADGPLRRHLAELLAGEAIGISFGSEASRLARIADEVIVIGPGDMRTAHSERECVRVAELERWTKVLTALMSAERQHT